jgi:hypothetical protein
MSAHGSAVLDGIKRKPVAMRGEGVLRKLEVGSEARQFVGRIIARAIEVAEMSHKEASIRMGLSDDGAQISRWCSGVEPPSLARIASVPRLACGLSVALAELSDLTEVRTVISIKQEKRA